MKHWAFKSGFSLLLLGTAAAVAVPAVGQDAPQSILPDIFGDEPAPQPAAPQRPALPAGEGTETGHAGAPAETATAPLAPALAPSAPDPLALPSSVQRSFQRIGPLTPELGGYGPAVFAGSDGLFLSALMKRIEAPLASRWGHIVLRRALLTQHATPARIRPADWVAARTALLLRLGEGDGARLLIDTIPTDGFTPRMYGVAGRAYLATADLPGLCRIGLTASTLSKDVMWPMINGICASLEGDDMTATTTLDGLRRQRRIKLFDVQLAERIASALVGGNKAANIEWDDVDRISLYHFGMATAAGVRIPDDKLTGMGPPAQGWVMRAAQVPLDQRIMATLTAARLGIASARELNNLVAIEGATIAPEAFAEARPGLLRTAHVARDPAARLTAMRELWQQGKDADSRYALRILTAAAAARFPIGSAHHESAPVLIASMLTAGHLDRAVQWWPHLAEAEDAVRLNAWPMLVLADRTRSVPLTKALFDDWWSHEREMRGEARALRRAQILFAALEGTGRIGASEWRDLAKDLDLAPQNDSWFKQMEQAAQARQSGAVAALAATGLQGRWATVSPQHLQAILKAYRAVGLADEARMMAVEGLTRN